MITNPALDRDLQKAIELKCSECYGAMAVANSLGGSPSPEWILARTNMLVDLVAEARNRGIVTAEWKSAVDRATLVDTKKYCEAVSKIMRLSNARAELTDTGWVLDGLPVGENVDQAIATLGV